LAAARQAYISKGNPEDFWYRQINRGANIKGGASDPNFLLGWYAETLLESSPQNEFLVNEEVYAIFPELREE
jgi:hypothetical protein